MFISTNSIISSMWTHRDHFFSVISSFEFWHFHVSNSMNTNITFFFWIFFFLFLFFFSWTYISNKNRKARKTFKIIYSPCRTKEKRNRESRLQDFKRRLIKIKQLKIFIQNFLKLQSNKNLVYILKYKYTIVFFK